IVFIDAPDDLAIGEHVIVLVRPVAGWAGELGALEDQRRHHRHRLPPQSPSASRFTAGATRDQDLTGQLVELGAAGCGNIFREKASGARTDRPELAKAIRRLGAGDVLVVTRLDRLARSTRDLLNILDALAKAGAGFKSLHDVWADTTTPHGRLM